MIWTQRPVLTDDDFEPVVSVGSLGADDPITVFSIHDGDRIPRGPLGPQAAVIATRPEIQSAFLRERDWGADLVAQHLAEALGLGGRLRVDLARVVLDFGRFPGVSEATEGYLSRRALSPPIADLITQKAKHRLITGYYDRMALAFARQTAAARISVGVHTFDRPGEGTAAGGTLELVTRPLQYPQGEGVRSFDPLFPDVLCGPTCNRSFVLQTVLDRAPYLHGLDHSYDMPEGSVEIRLQAWRYFRFLRKQFIAAHPETRDREGHQRVWSMLLDITRRTSDGELLRGYLHDYRDAPSGQRALFAEARRAYLEIARHLDLHENDLVHGYRFSTERPSCIAIEVRRDLLVDVDAETGTVVPRPDAAAKAAEVAALAAPVIQEHLLAFFPESVLPLARPA